MSLDRRSQSGSAHTGLGEWLLQRLSSVYMAGFVLYAVVRFSLAPIQDYMAWKQWVGQGIVRIALALFFASVLVHAWVGLRSVFMDYIKPLWLRFTLLLAVAVGLITLGLWVAQLLMMLES
jgi:succinate dehydrogenase / fumarate reductase membrane anchor subunit